MSFNTIKIERRLPVVGGFVEVPGDQNDLPPVTADEIVNALGTDLVTKFQFGTTDKMNFVALDEHAIDAVPTNDLHEQIRDVARSKL